MITNVRIPLKVVQLEFSISFGTLVLQYKRQSLKSLGRYTDKFNEIISDNYYRNIKNALDAYLIFNLPHHNVLLNDFHLVFLI